MRSWMLLVLCLGLPCWGATLKGRVTNSDGMALYKARVVVMHDLASLLVHRDNTDFNGFYHFNLDPGPYRIFVLKRGFHPIFSKLLILHENEDFDLELRLENRREWVSIPEAGARTNRIKEVYRNSNLQHLRSTSLMPATNLSAPSQSTRFSGSIQSDVRSHLNGDLGRQSQVEVQARVSEVVSMNSVLTSQRGDSESDEVTQLHTRLAVDFDDLDLSMGVGTIRAANRKGSSNMAHIEGRYGRRYKMKTGIEVFQSQSKNRRQQELSFNQSADYNLGNHFLQHEALLTSWRDDTQALAQRATFSSQWRNLASDWLTLAVSMDRLSLRKNQTHATQLWLQAEPLRLAQPLGISTRLGYRTDENGGVILQKHKLSGAFSHWDFATSYHEDSTYLSLTSKDVFGDYLSQPSTPYGNENFVANRNHHWGLALSYTHPHGLRSDLKWSRTRESSKMLYIAAGSNFKPTSQHEMDRLDYSLNTGELNATLMLSFSKHESDLHAFNQTEMSYRQRLVPLRRSRLGLLLELRVQNNPNLPAWWLLESLPWQTDASGQWYQGQLAFQF